MRATHRFDLVRIWPKLAVASALVILATSMVAGGVLAGNTSKQIYFGSGPFPASSFNYPANYSLSFTPVSGSRVTSAYVTIQNKGGGTLNHVILEGGANAPDPRTNVNFIPDSTHGSPPICSGTPATCIPSLPDGFQYVAAFAPSGHPCTIYNGLVPAMTGRDIKCDIGQLGNNASVTFRIGISVPANSTSASAAYQTWFTASGNEGTSNQGSNQDAFFALGTITVDPTTPCTDANFFASGTVDSGLPNCDQPATLTGGAFTTGAFASVRVADTALCPPVAGVKCFGKGVFANVESGARVSGGLQWTVRWQKALLNGTPKGVIHFLDGYDAVTNAKAYETIDFKSTAQCPATIVANTKLPCLNGKPGFVTVGTTTYFQAIFTTSGNGMGRGY